MSNYSLNELLTPINRGSEYVTEVHQDKLTTLEGFHNDKIRKFTSMRESLPQIKQELSTLRERLADWPLEKRFNDEHKECMEREADLIKRISDIESDKDMTLPDHNQ
jgi:hypothetical protein